MKKISWKTIAMIILFAVSFISLCIVAFAPLCLTWSGTAFLLTTVTLTGYSLNYLVERYEKIFK